MITITQQKQYKEDGYFIVRNLVDPLIITEIKDTILDFIDNPGNLKKVLDLELVVHKGKGEHLTHKEKFRKLQQLGRHRPKVGIIIMQILMFYQ